jgi:hypothetical protein
MRRARPGASSWGRLCARPADLRRPADPVYLAPPPPGIPISLSLIYMAVAARVGLCMEPVNLPAHLMLRPVVTPRRGAAAEPPPPPPAPPAQAPPAPPASGARGAGGGQGVAAAGVVGEEGEEDDPERPGLLVDAFHGGELCWLADAEERLSSITGMQVGVGGGSIGGKVRRRAAAADGAAAGGPSEPQLRGARRAPPARSAPAHPAPGALPRPARSSSTRAGRRARRRR